MLLSPDVMDREVNALQNEEPARSFISGPPQDQMLDMVFEDSARYKSVIETNRDRIKERYKPVKEAEKFNKAVVNFSRKYALGQAMKDMGIDAADDPAAAVYDGLNELFFEKLGLERGLEAMKVPFDDLKDIAATLCRDGPVKGFSELSEEDVYNILKMSY